MFSSIWGVNNILILKEHENEQELRIIIGSILEFMTMNDWRGACHESCGIFFVLLNELGIPCEWRLGEVRYRVKTINGHPIVFDHSWILINNEIFDLAIYKTRMHDLDSAPTIRNLSLTTREEPEVIYESNSGWGDDPMTIFVKTTPLTEYFSRSPMHPTLGTWYLILLIAKKLKLSLDINALKAKYSGIFWS
jgi:hypothetical protein